MTKKHDSMALFVDSLSEHGKITYALAEAGLNYSQYKTLLKTDNKFAKSVEEAREYATEKEFDSISDALSLYPNPHAAKVFSDNLKWRLTKIQPERFGERINVKNTHTVDLTDRFRAALERLHAVSTPLIDVTPNAETGQQSTPNAPVTLDSPDISTAYDSVSPDRQSDQPSDSVTE